MITDAYVQPFGIAALSSEYVPRTSAFKGDRLHSGRAIGVGLVAALAIGVGCGTSSPSASPSQATAPTTERVTTTIAVPGYHPDAAEVMDDCSAIDLADSGEGADLNESTLRSTLGLSPHDLATMRDACETYDQSLEMSLPFNADGTAQDPSSASYSDQLSAAKETAAELAGAN